MTDCPKCRRWKKWEGGSIDADTGEFVNPTTLVQHIDLCADCRGLPNITQTKQTGGCLRRWLKADIAIADGGDSDHTAAPAVARIEDARVRIHSIPTAEVSCDRGGILVCELYPVEPPLQDAVEHVTHANALLAS